MHVSIQWGDPSVSWGKYSDGKWNIDISKATEVTLFLKSDIGQYGKRKNMQGKPRSDTYIVLFLLNVQCVKTENFL